LKALGLDKLEEETTPDLEAFAVNSTRRMLKEKGKDYLWENRHLLKDQLEYLATM
jgi:hypothetical protein